MRNYSLIQVIIDFLINQVLFPYQVIWLKLMLTERYYACLGSRQIGKGFVVAIFLAIVLATQYDTEWVVMSASNKHAKTIIKDIKFWLNKFKTLASWTGSQFPKIESSNLNEIRTSWGAAVTASANTVNAVTGTRGGVIMDEVPLIKDAEEVYSSGLTQVERAIDLGKFAAFFAFGNASPQGTWWQEWWSRRQKNAAGWKLNTTTWVDAKLSDGCSWAEIKAQRLEIINRLNGNLGAFDRWYMCRFISSRSDLFPYEYLLSKRYDFGANVPVWWNQAPQTLGYDIGRVTDPAAVSPLILSPDNYRYAQQTVYLRDVSSPDQRAVIKTLAKRRNTLAIGVDTSALGKMTSDELKKDFGPLAPIRDLAQTRESKVELFQDLKGSLDSDRLKIAANDIDLMMQLSSVRATVTDKDNVVIEIPKTALGHGDGAVALALANRVTPLFTPKRSDIADYSEAPKPLDWTTTL